MAEFFTNYAQPQQRTSLADMVNAASGIQNFQQAQQLQPLQLQEAQLRLQQAQQMNPLQVQEAQQRLATLQQAFEQAKQVNPLTLEQEKQKTTQSQLKTIEDNFGLNDKQIKYLKNEAGAAINDKRISSGDPEKIAEALKEREEQARLVGLPEPMIKGVFGALNKVGLDHPHKLPDVLANLVESNPNAPSAQTKALTPLSAQAGVEGKDIYGNPTQIVRDRFGRIIQAPLPTAGDNNMRFAPGESADTLKAMQDERITAKDSATGARNALNNVQTIKKYLPLAETGKNSEAIAGFQSMFGNLTGDTAAEKAAAARDIIQKNIADLGLQKNAALGGKYVASLDASLQSLADAGKNPTAIKKSMNQLEPLLQHAYYYQQGLEKAIANNGGNVQVKRAFDNKMINAFDPQAMMAYNAYKAGDKKAFAEITSTMSDKEKNDIQDKMVKYSKLVNGNLQ